LITQNVDGLHQRAGSAEVIEFHGNIHRNRCDHHGVQQVDTSHCNEPPPCPRCRGLLRPDVVWFGESIPPAALQASEAAALDCDAMLVAGTAGQVYPAAGLAEMAAQRRALLIEINIERTPLSALMDYCLTRPSDRQLPLLVDALSQAQRQSPPR
jgi:NAD-dependent deacetylase